MKFLTEIDYQKFYIYESNITTHSTKKCLSYALLTIPIEFCLSAIQEFNISKFKTLNLHNP